MMKTKTCWNCKAELDTDDRFCKQCGKGQTDAAPWYYHPFWIAFLTVTALGPFSLFLIWRTPKLGRTGKWGASVLVLAFTVVLIAGLVDAVEILRKTLGRYGIGF